MRSRYVETASVTPIIELALHDSFTKHRTSRFFSVSTSFIERGRISGARGNTAF
jgi:hypothetical protein